MPLGGLSLGPLQRKLTELAPSPRDPRLNRRLGQPQNLPDFPVAELVHGLEQKWLAVAIGQKSGQLHETPAFFAVAGPFACAAGPADKRLLEFLVDAQVFGAALA